MLAQAMAQQVAVVAQLLRQTVGLAAAGEVTPKNLLFPQRQRIRMQLVRQELRVEPVVVDWLEVQALRE
jgi:hypothetical protein